MTNEHTERVKRDEIIVGSQNYYDLFKGRNEVSKQVLVIEGEAGIGKTILCTSIVDDWASGMHFQDFLITLLDLLPLDQINLASVSSILDLFRMLYDLENDDAFCLVKYLRSHPSNIIIVMDGWDQCCEASYQQGSFLNSLIFDNPFPINSSVTMLLASRPGCRLPQFHQFISIIKGFSKETISTCITSEFSCDPGKMEYFSEQLKSNNMLVGSMCHVPFNLALILNLCQSDVPLPVTWTELYTTFVWGLARLSVKNSGKYEHDIDHLSCYDDLPRELQ